MNPLKRVYRNVTKTPVALLTLVGVAAAGTAAVVMKKSKKKVLDCTAGIWGPSIPLDPEIATRLSPAAVQQNQGNSYNLTIAAQDKLFERLAWYYGNDPYPRSVALRKVLTEIAPKCNWWSDQDVAFDEKMGGVWLSAWALAAVVEADFGRSFDVKPNAEGVIPRTALGLPANPANPNNSPLIEFIVSDPDGKYAEPLLAMTVDNDNWSILGFNVKGSGVPARFAGKHGHERGSVVKLTPPEIRKVIG